MRRSARDKVSFADLVVLGEHGRREGRKDRPRHRHGAVHPGRGDTTQEWTDEESFAHLEPKSDGFRNYIGEGNRLRRTCLVDRRTC